MTGHPDFSRGDRLWFQPAGQKVAKLFATVEDVILGAEGAPERVVARLKEPSGGHDLVLLTFDRTDAYGDD